MTEEEITEAKELVETVRSGPPSYNPDVVRTLRLADLLIAAVNEVQYLQRASEEQSCLSR